jgi:hypothetical protein
MNSSIELKSLKNLKKLPVKDSIVDKNGTSQNIPRRKPDTLDHKELSSHGELLSNSSVIEKLKELEIILLELYPTLFKKLSDYLHYFNVKNPLNFGISYFYERTETNPFHELQLIISIDDNGLTEQTQLTYSDIKEIVQSLFLNEFNRVLDEKFGFHVSIDSKSKIEELFLSMRFEYVATNRYVIDEYISNLFKYMLGYSLFHSFFTQRFLEIMDDTLKECSDKVLNAILFLYPTIANPEELLLRFENDIYPKATIRNKVNTRALHLEYYAIYKNERKQKQELLDASLEVN